MNKYSFVVFHREITSFLLELQRLGMMDITRSHKAVDEQSKEALDTLKRFDNAARSVNSILKEVAEKADKKAQVDSDPVVINADDDTLLPTIEELLEERASLLEAFRDTKRLKNEAEPWGFFSYEDLRNLNKMGIKGHFYAINAKRFNEEWKEQYPLTIMNETGGYKYFVILSPEDEPYNFEYPESKLPDKCSDEYAEELLLIEKELNENIRYLQSIAERLPDLERKRSELASATDLYLADVSSSREAEDHIVVMEGFAPADNDAEIKELLDRSGVIYLQDKATVEDNPPVKLKNNFFVRLFEPIGNLYMLPRYDELDLTPYFAPFYMLFFGLCLGDMGYGLVLAILGTGIIFAVPKFKSYGWLIMFLGFGAILMPALNGTFFGTKLNEVFTLPDAINNFFFSDLKMFWFAIIFGIFQIVFARTLSALYAIKHKGWQHGMSNLGWALLVTALSFMYASGELGRDILPSMVTKIMAGISVVLILFFSKTEGNIIKRLFGGITSLYDITGFFGDMLSYIRLFGLGTAGAILGMVINSIAMQFTGIPYVGWVVTVLFLIFGHIFVLALSCLGAFVHPLRLTFVEFYKNSGFVGGGKAYKPLSKNEN
jgi:V/A-type H+-transporting ATPase subunit I